MDQSGSMAYCEQFISDPSRTLFILLTDLYERGNESHLVRRMGDIVALVVISAADMS